MLHIPPTNLLLLTAKQEPYKKAYPLMKNIEEFSRKSSEGPAGRKRSDIKGIRTRQKNKRGESKVESNDSPEIPNREETSDIPGLPSRGQSKCIPAKPTSTIIIIKESVPKQNTHTITIRVYCKMDVSIHTHTHTHTHTHSHYQTKRSSAKHLHITIIMFCKMNTYKQPPLKYSSAKY